ncbi:MAG: TRAP transporter substrate-binding protein [Rhodospirillaceae bacterium]|nr:TRAP transporter substrate-binding protein [Rhodospirillaceae bacterium]
MNYRVGRAIALAMPLAALAAAAGAQEKIELKFSHYAPPTHGFQRDLLEPWAAELAKRTGGKLTVRIFAANSPFGNIANQADQVKAGVTDAAWGLNGVPRGRFPASMVMELPFMAPSSRQASKVLWAMHDGALAAEYKPFKMLAVHCHTPGGFFTRTKRLTDLDGLKGLRIRAPSVQVQNLLQYLGAVPVTMGPAQAYEALEKGTIEGASLIYDGLYAFRLHGLVKYYLEAKIYTSCFHVVMNPRKYQSLPAAYRKAIDETTGQVWVDRLGQLWDQWDAAGRTATLAKGVEEVKVSDATRAKWETQLKPHIDKELAEMEKQGVKNARAIYAEMKRRVAELAK